MPKLNHEAIVVEEGDASRQILFMVCVSHVLVAYILELNKHMTAREKFY